MRVIYPRIFFFGGELSLLNLIIYKICIEILPKMQ